VPSLKIFQSSHEKITISALVVLSQSDDKNFFMECLNSLHRCVEALDEIVLVFNGLLDNELEKNINLLFRGSNCKLQIIHTNNFYGFAIALNIGLKHISSDWIMRIDPDDICLVNRVSVFKFLLNFNDFDIFSSSVLLYSRLNHSIKVKHYPNFTGDYKKYLWLKNPIAHPSSIIKKSIILKHGGYREIPFMEDYDLWLRLSKANASFFNINLPLIKFNVDQLSRRRRRLQVLKSEIKILKIKRDSLNLNYPLLLISFIIRLGFYIFPWYGKY
jgi:glycosyltransferase involved in cell wall biosynthesis